MKLTTPTAGHTIASTAVAFSGQTLTDQHDIAANVNKPGARTDKDP